MGSLVCIIQCLFEDVYGVLAHLVRHMGVEVLGDTYICVAQASCNIFWQSVILHQRGGVGMTERMGVQSNLAHLVEDAATAHEFAYLVSAYQIQPGYIGRAFQAF